LHCYLIAVELLGALNVRVLLSHCVMICHVIASFQNSYINQS